MVRRKQNYRKEISMRHKVTDGLISRQKPDQSELEQNMKRLTSNRRALLENLDVGPLLGTTVLLAGAAGSRSAGAEDNLQGNKRPLGLLIISGHEISGILVGLVEETKNGKLEFSASTLGTFPRLHKDEILTHHDNRPQVERSE